ncbi:T9SS type B sorting domain-containing protein [Flavobacterium sp.]|uniref:T9SS type B sorting domain-containing protein n=1 Tax=Flavobacterium sp. TaxID=239 RepID=UPI0025BB7C07|nr:choice-of-anchor L domain-containing protein [Flavobacterium sp.]
MDENYTTFQLVNDVLINSPCGQASNIVVSGWNFNNGNSFGYFNANGSNFPFAEGMVLTTGRAAAAVGPNDSILSDGPTNWVGDNDLEQAVGVNNTINATSLEFDFLPNGNFFSFNYIFSSEQYLSNPSSNQCGYTDGFAFLLKKANTTDAYENLAVVPFTQIPVTVNTVRGSGTICPSSNDQYFDAFNGQDHPTNYNGQTKSMKAQATVEPGVLYHIKIVIADQGNNLYDSAIFLEGGSFKAEVNLGDDMLISNNRALCPGQTTTLDAQINGALSYVWYSGTNVIPGETGPTYTVTTAGIYSVEVDLGSGCFATGDIEIEYVSAPPPYLPTATLVQCDPDNNGISTFNLTSIIDTISVNFGAYPDITFYPTMADALVPQNPILNPLYYDAAHGTTVVAKMRFGFSCYVYSTISLELTYQPAMPQTITVCDTTGASDGSTDFDLAMQVTPLVLANMPVGLTVAYYLTNADALAQISPLSNNFTNSVPNQQVIYARVFSGTSCYDIVTVTLNVTSLAPSGFDPETITICPNDTATLSVAGSFDSYLWSTGATSAQITVNTPGVYTLTVTNTIGCSAVKQFTVALADPPVFNSVQIFSQNGNETGITVDYSGSGQYEFSVDGTTFQPSPVFGNLSGGNYAIYIRDSAGCYLVGPYPVFLIRYPTFFTPNGDGINDIWEIKDLSSQPSSQVRIFDRYGKLLYDFRGSDTGWNGEYDSAKLPSTDYWFVLQLGDGRAVRGHFSLKR